MATEKERREWRVLNLQTERGGWRRKDLKALGVPWPPPKGWKAQFIEGGEPMKGCTFCDGSDGVILHWCMGQPCDYPLPVARIRSDPPKGQKATLPVKQCWKAKSHPPHAHFAKCEHRT